MGNLPPFANTFVADLFYQTSKLPVTFFVFSVLFLDSLDQLSDEDDGRALRWLPTSLPKNVHIVVSTLPTTGGCLAVLKTKLKPEINAHMYLEACHLRKLFCEASMYSLEKA